MNSRTEDQQGVFLRVMSFNLRRRMDMWTWNRADRWSVRQHRVHALLQKERPTVLAAQELLPDQARFVKSSLGSAYGCIGRGRERHGTGEGCPVFYDTERLELLEWRQFMLSKTPEKSGSRSWGALFPRLLVSASFRERRTGAAFRLVNTHLDPLSRRSRLHSAAMIRSHVASSLEPVVVAGDLNAGPGSAAVGALLEHDLLTDAWLTARRQLTPEYATYAKYRQPRRGRRIDWIMTTPDIGVDRIAINADEFDGGWPSDHLPVQATLILPETVAHT